MMGSQSIRVLSVHWGFSIGGVAQYAAILDHVKDHAPIALSTICILNRQRHIDEKTLGRLSSLTIIERRGPLDIRWIAALRRHIEVLDPHLIMTHGFNGHFAAYVATCCTRSKQKFIASYHGEYHPPTRLKGLVAGIYNGLTEHYMRHVASSVVSVADYCKKYLVSKGVDPKKITVIHNGIPDTKWPDTYAQLRRELNLPLSGVVIGAMSRLDPEKGISYLLKAFQRVAELKPDAWLVIVGTGSQEHYLRDLAVDLRIQDRVRFAGFRSEASRLLGAFDVFALPSLAEYHSIGLLEAMRAGKAIVATDVGGNTESVSHDREGLIVHARDVDGLAAALRVLVENSDLRSRLGEAARRRFSEEFDVAIMVKETAGWMVRAADY